MDKAQLTEIGRQLFGKRWQTKLANELGLSPQHLRKYVSGKSRISESRANHIKLLLYLDQRGLLADYRSETIFEAAKGLK